MPTVDIDLLREDAILAEMVHRLVEAFQPERIYLFGSKARDESGGDSDYDLMVVVTHSDLPGYRRDQRAYRTLRGLGVAKDVLVWTAEEFEKRVRFPASLPATIIREERLLYAAA
ncbi:MAG: nucleotidyltransferase domain-containing protein [Candidatus Abyssobacteria bacterium SURF_17]|uniref:Nucleotidyltransferase domain-containing protein n=1 Tax=Candidatus Abyssobacteria bacterium SURF_17 TaxID=2093361 RepID=A0A419F1V7_9BACT|nr:MAG: nucleotidyltransferase domain-containing protein [Candidatus Abyssubacteria bacterium SURF_17]